MANDFVIRISAEDKATAVVKKIQDALGKITGPIDKAQKKTASLGSVGQTGLSKLRKGLDSVSNSASKVVDKIVEIIPGLTAIGGAASIAGLSALATKFGNFGFGLNKSSKLLDMNAQDLAAWHVAAKRAGVSADEFDSSMASSQGAIRGAAFGADPHAMMMLQKMGVQIQRNRDGSIDYLSTQQKIMTALAKQPSVEGQRDAANALGMGALLPMIQQGTYAADKARAMRKGLVPTPEEIARAVAFHQNVNDLEDSVTGLGNSVGSKLIPVLDPLVKGFASWLDGHRVEIANAIAGAVQKFSDWIKSIDWTEVVSKMNKLFDAMGGIKGIAIAIAAITFAGPIGGVLGLITGLTKLSAVVLPAAIAGMTALAAAGFLAETARQSALDNSIHKLPGEMDDQRDQRVADAAAGGVVTPDAGGAKNADLGGRFFNWVKGITGGNSNQASTKDVLSQLQGSGWGKNQAAGIAANLFAESKFNPAAVGDNGHAYGIGQWHEDRQKLFAKWAGHDIHGSSLKEQLKFVDYELRHGDGQSQIAGRALPMVHSAAAAGRIVSQYYERPADVESEARRRGALAGSIASSSDGGAYGVASNPSAGTEDRADRASRGAPASDSANGPAAQNDSGRADRLAAMQSAAPQVNVTVHNALPGTKVEAKSPDGGYLPTKINYALRGADGASP